VIRTPLDQIIEQLASTTDFSADEIYVFYLLNVYGALDVDTILKHSKSRSWQHSIPSTLEGLQTKRIVSLTDNTYVANSIDEFYEIIAEQTDLTLSDIRALKDFF